MKRFILLLLLVPSLLQAQMFPAIQAPAPVIVDTLPMFGRTNEGYGNSIMLGISASPQASNRWFKLFCDAKGATESNHGVSGQTLQSNVCGGSTFSNTTIVTYNSSTSGGLFIDLGTNDIGQNATGTYSAATFQTTLEATIDYAHNTKGWPYRSIIILTPYYAVDYNAYIGAFTCTPPLGSTPADQTLAAAYATAAINAAVNKGTRYMDIRAAMIAAGFDATYYAADHLHPNNTGHAAIATLVSNYFLTHSLKWFVLIVLIPTLMMGGGKIASINEHKKAA